MRVHLVVLAGVVLAGVLLVGVAAHADPHAPQPAATDGTIKGTVIFEGEPPERVKLKRTSDPECAKTEKLSEDVIVTHGKLRDVLVRITAGADGTFAPPTAPAVIDQRECMYTPRVLGVMAGQAIAIRNSDNTFHNVRGTLGKKALWNKPQAPHDPDLTAPHTPAAGELIELQCDIHPWMHAYAVVADNPYFAVTGDDGTFTLSGLPPGTYTVEAWHPVLGTRTVKIVLGVGPKGHVNARLSYKAQDMPGPTP